MWVVDRKQSIDICWPYMAFCTACILKNSQNFQYCNKSINLKTVITMVMKILNR